MHLLIGHLTLHRSHSPIQHIIWNYVILLSFYSSEKSRCESGKVINNASEDPLRNDIHEYRKE